MDPLSTRRSPMCLLMIFLNGFMLKFYSELYSSVRCLFFSQDLLGFKNQILGADSINRVFRNSHPVGWTLRRVGFIRKTVRDFLADHLGNVDGLTFIFS